MGVRKGVLLSVFYSGDDRSAVMKFYDPERDEVFLIKDNTGHRPYLLTDAPHDKIEELLPGNLQARVEGAYRVKKYDVLRDRWVELTKLEAKDPLAIGGSGKNIREELSKKGYRVWEAKIKYYDCYVYDRQLVPGCYYEVGDEVKRIHERGEIGEEFRDLDQETVRILEGLMPLFDQPSPNLRNLAVDIEVLTTEGKVPDPSNPVKPVLAIAFVGSDGRREVFMLSRGKEPPEELNGAKVRVYESEGKMLRDALDLISSYPLVFTYNGDNFDFPYLARRAKELGVSPKPIRLERDRALLDTGIHVDLYKFFNNRSIQGYVFKNRYLGYTLDEISEALLGERKVEISTYDFSKVDSVTLAKYCLQDAVLTHKLGNINSGEIIRLLFLLARISKMSLEEVSRQGVSQWIKNMIFFEYRRRNWLIPEKEEIMKVRGERTYSKALIKGKKYMGAIVLNPVPGVHFRVAVMDFASLYPSIIGRWGVSFETINCPHKECRENRPVEELPHWICTKDLGIIPKIIRALRDVRVKRYKRLAKTSQGELKEWYDTVQSSLKVFLNASYGVFGYENFPLYSPPVAEMITALGRKAITLSVKMAEEMGLKVIYGDSVSPDTLVITRDGQVRIEDLFKEVHLVSGGKEYYFPEDLYVLSLDSGEPAFKRVRYVMRHRTDKEMYRVEFPGGHVDVTEDHSLMVLDGSLRPAKPKALRGYLVRLVPVEDSGLLAYKVQKVRPLQVSRVDTPEYVYDLEVEGTHTFFGNGILLHNTDSLFIKDATEEQIRRLEERVESLLGIDLELDNWFRYVVFSSLKKNYLGVTKDGAVVVKGLLGKKRNIPDFVKQAFQEVLNVLKEVETPEDFERAKEKISQIIRDYVERLKSGDFKVEDLAFRTMLTKDLDSYVKTTPQHVKVARMLRARGVVVVPGQVISYVKVRGGEGVYPVEMAKKSDIDVDKYVEIMRSTFEQILDALDVDFDEIVSKRKSTSLTDFF